jgi:hypothetical protein
MEGGGVGADVAPTVPLAILDHWIPLRDKDGVAEVVEEPGEVVETIAERFGFPVFELADDRSRPEAVPREGAQNRQVESFRVRLQQRHVSDTAFGKERVQPNGLHCGRRLMAWVKRGKGADPRRDITRVERDGLTVAFGDGPPIDVDVGQSSDPAQEFFSIPRVRLKRPYLPAVLCEIPQLRADVRADIDEHTARGCEGMADNVYLVIRHWTQHLPRNTHGVELRYSCRATSTPSSLNHDMSWKVHCGNRLGSLPAAYSGDEIWGTRVQRRGPVSLT